MTGPIAAAGPTNGHPDEIRVLIADDHPVVRDGLRAMLHEEGIRVVGEVSNGRQAVDRLAALRPDVILMDIHMPDMDGLAATRLIKHDAPAVSVIVVTSFESKNYLRDAIAAGAAGYLLKGMSRSLLLESIRIVRDGGSMFDPKMLSDLLREVAEGGSDVPAEALDALSDRERETLMLVAQGLTNREIADRLGYSVGTIKNVVQQVIEKLGVSDRTQAAVLGVRAGLELS